VGSREIAINRNVNVRNVNANNASGKNRAANRVAVSKADDKVGYVGLTSGGRRLPPLFTSANRQKD
jgi:hypothetical protein